jgi:hypothetical protein
MQLKKKEHKDALKQKVDDRQEKKKEGKVKKLMDQNKDHEFK